MDLDLPFDQLISQLEDTRSVLAKTRLVRKFAESHCSPIIDGSRAVFYYVSEDALTVAIEGDWTNWKPTALMAYLPDTPLWYRVERFPLSARLEYRIVVNGHPRLDPYNPNSALNGRGTHSEFHMPEFRLPREFTDKTPLARGIIEEHWLKSQILEDRRTFWICFPPRYDLERNYPVAYFNDGDGYLYNADLPHLMDYLIEQGQVEPFIAVLLRPNEREKEYGLNNQYVRFLADELVPYMDDNYSTRTDAASRAIIGSSLGAVCAAHVARRRPNLFGLVGGQSGKYALKREALFEDYAASQNLGLRFHLSVGQFETDIRGRGIPEDNLVEAQRRFAALLQRKGYLVSSAEYPEGHQWGFWRGHIGDALKFFWGTQKTPAGRLRPTHKHKPFQKRLPDVP
jgi:enterochelin esterase-like enzyme